MHLEWGKVLAWWPSACFLKFLSPLQIFSAGRKWKDMRVFHDRGSKTSKCQMSVCVCVCVGERVKIWTSDFSSVGGGSFSNNHIFFFFFFLIPSVHFSSVQFSRSVVSDSLQSHELQHARPPCPSPTPKVHSDSSPLSQWYHPAISSSIVPFSSCPQSFSASEPFPMSHLFAWGGQSTGVSALASFLPKNTQGWSPLGWTGWTSLQSKGLPRVFSNTTVQEHQFFGAQLSPQSNSHIHTWPLEKP